MSNFARALVLGATLAAMNLAGVTTLAHAQASDEPASSQDARQPPTERQVGEPWRHRQLTADQPATVGDILRPPTERQVGEPWRHPTSAPVPPAEPSGQPSWLAASLGILAAALALAGGWPCWPSDGQTAGLGSDTRPDHDHGHAARWGCRAHPAAPSALPSTITC